MRWATRERDGDKYSEITTQLEMDALLARVAGFHDAMAKELHLSNRGWVEPDRSMMMSHRFDARLLVQSQWDPVAIELLFIGIETLSADKKSGRVLGRIGRD